MQDTRPSMRVIVFIIENTVLALLYWGVSHLNFLIFKNAGILPMPIWPAAAVAAVAAFYRSWRIAPALAIGTILANHVSLGAPLFYACCIAIMNTAGPIAGAALMRLRVTSSLTIRGFADVLVVFIILTAIVPVLTASGGIGFKRMLGLVPPEAVLVSWLKWATAHSLGTMLFAVPVFAWIKGRHG